MDQTRVLELKTALKDRLDKIDLGMKNAVKIDGVNSSVSGPDADSIRGLMMEAKDIKSAIDAEVFGTETKAWLDSPERESAAMQAQAGAIKHSVKSLGERFTESDEFKALVKAGAATMPSPFEVEMYDVARAGYGRKDVWTGSGDRTIQHGFGNIQFDPMVPRPHRPMRVRDLFPVAATSANLIDYFRVLGFSEGTNPTGRGSAASVADYVPGSPGNFGLKPKSNLTFESAQAPVRTIAHWEAAHRNVLDDVPQLQSTINNELLYGLTLEEDRQILNGSGLNEELLGILLTDNIQTYTQDVSEPKSDALRRAATKAVIANYPPTGYVLHPYDWEDIELQKGSGDGQYMLFTNIAVGASSQAWRLPIVETPAIDEGTFLVGAFGIGAQVYDRQQANVRIAEQHADFFVRNAVAILAEERLALAVKRPESFVKGTFTTDLTSAS
jgi:regulator of extracellular matrix RemA (YlzA/DUF370 family)